MVRYVTRPPHRTVAQKMAEQSQDLSVRSDTDTLDTTDTSCAVVAEPQIIAKPSSVGELPDDQREPARTQNPRSRRLSDARLSGATDRPDVKAGPTPASTARLSSSRRKSLPVPNELAGSNSAAAPQPQSRRKSASPKEPSSTGELSDDLPELEPVARKPRSRRSSDARLIGATNRPDVEADPAPESTARRSKSRHRTLPVLNEGLLGKSASPEKPASADELPDDLPELVPIAQKPRSRRSSDARLTGATKRTDVEAGPAPESTARRSSSRRRSLPVPNEINGSNSTTAPRPQSRRKSASPKEPSSTGQLSDDLPEPVAQQPRSRRSSDARLTGATDRPDIEADPAPESTARRSSSRRKSLPVLNEGFLDKSASPKKPSSAGELPEDLPELETIAQKPPSRSSSDARLTGATERPDVEAGPAPESTARRSSSRRKSLPVANEINGSNTAAAPRPQSRRKSTSPKKPSSAGELPDDLPELESIAQNPRSGSSSDARLTGATERPDVEADSAPESTARSSPPVPNEITGSNSAAAPRPRSSRKSASPKKSTRVLEEIVHLQNSTERVIPRLRFATIIREVLQNYFGRQLRITAESLMCLQEAAELFITQLLEDSYRCTLHRDRTTLTPKDMRLALTLRNDSVLLRC